MHHAQQLEHVRKIVCKVLQDHGVDTTARPMSERILIRDGFYCGRRFSCAGFRALWFIEEKTLKFYGPEGHYLTTVSADLPSDSRADRQVA